MKYTQNTVAKVFKVYSGVNSIACILLLFILAGTTGISDVAGIIWIAVSIVVNFGSKDMTIGTLLNSRAGFCNLKFCQNVFCVRAFMYGNIGYHVLVGHIPIGALVGVPLDILGNHHSIGAV